MHQYTPTTIKPTIVWKQSNELTSIKFKTTPLGGKVVTTIFCDMRDVVYKEYIYMGL